jgi:hypothetical protein
MIFDFFLSDAIVPCGTIVNENHPFSHSSDPLKVKYPSFFSQWKCFCILHRKRTFIFQIIGSIETRKTLQYFHNNFHSKALFIF